MFLLNGFCLGVRRAMARALTPFDTKTTKQLHGLREGAAHASFREFLNLQILEHYTCTFYAEL
jgi:hypothetical protein